MNYDRAFLCKMLFVMGLLVGGTMAVYETLAPAYNTTDEVSYPELNAQDLSRNVTIEWKGPQVIDLGRLLEQYGVSNQTIQKYSFIFCCVHIFSNDTILSIWNDSSVAVYHIHVVGTIEYLGLNTHSYSHVFDYTIVVPISSSTYNFNVTRVLGQ